MFNVKFSTPEVQTFVEVLLASLPNPVSSEDEIRRWYEASYLCLLKFDYYRYNIMRPPTIKIIGWPRVFTSRIDADMAASLLLGRLDKGMYSLLRLLVDPAYFGSHQTFDDRTVVLLIAVMEVLSDMHYGSLFGFVQSENAA